MTKWFLALILFVGIVGIWHYYVNFQPKKQPSSIISQPTPTSIKPMVESTAIFVPYWNVPGTVTFEPYNRFFYFGITANTNGVNKSETGFINLPSFVRAASGKETYLTLRLLDTETNLAIFKNQAARERIIAQTLAIAEQNGFKGVVLDLEVSALPFTDVQNNINQFVNEFYSSLSSNKMKLLVALYGDTFYRKRPFDVAFIASHSDEILVLAYDFHKSLGEPGPNFPLDGRQTYSYDFKLMIEDYLHAAPPEKLTVVFGMYGYDWVVDEKKRPIRRATALPLADIKKHFVDTCQWKNCLIQPDTVSAETEIDYVDSSVSEFAINHIIWYEDERSVNIKKDYLKKMGLGQTALWVYGYF